MFHCRQLIRESSIFGEVVELWSRLLTVLEEKEKEQEEQE